MILNSSELAFLIGFLIIFGIPFCLFVWFVISLVRFLNRH